MTYMEKKLYPLKFIPIASPRPWGGTDLVNVLGKKFTQIDQDGNEVSVPADTLIGESWELADMGFEDSVVENGFLAGNTIGDIMETYLERVVGDRVFEWYGTQFPLLIKFLNIHGKLSVQVHPDDTVARERYDSLGKAEVWYILDAKPGAKIYMGFDRDVSASEFYDACKAGTADSLLHVVHPKKGDVIFIKPGTVHAAEGGIMVCEIQESSDMTFRLYDWGRELNPATARKMHLEEAIDLIDYSKYDGSGFIPAPSGGDKSGTLTRVIADVPQFTVTHIRLFDGMHIYTDKLESFVVYSCIKGEVSLQMAGEDGITKDYRLRSGDTVLVPAECPDFVLSPIEQGSELIESVTHPEAEKDSYVDSPDVCEGDACEDDACEDDGCHCCGHHHDK